MLLCTISCKLSISHFPKLSIRICWESMNRRPITMST
uniref:Uncharacterized protein n=1 Tax=Schistosoma japonicum TaxID=6182 RepID=Q5BVT2_SCHJA|nr:unknown [Schistosoma japonicum]